MLPIHALSDEVYYNLLQAAQKFDPDIQLVLCAGAPDTPEIAAETEALVEELRAQRDGIFWVRLNFSYS